MKISNLYYSKGRYAIDNVALFQNIFQYNASSLANASNQSPRQTSIAESNTQTENGQTKIWILAIGIKDYPNFTSQKLPPLFNPLNDVKRMHDFWTSNAGGSVSELQIKVLRDSDATKENILRSAYEVYSHANPNDVVILYFSGHGAIGNLYAYDFKLNNRELNEILEGSRASKKICIIDACFSGSFKPKSILTPMGSSVDGASMFYTKLQEAGNGITYLLSCDVNERSVDVNDLGASLFTYYFLKGLSCEADGDHDGIISLMEIYDYVRREVVQYCSGHTYPDGTAAKQTPQISGTYDPYLPLSACGR
jgi:uncharacterized caspase-like protein